ncbi:MAG: hypothetical protein ACC652_04485, partial [Acidimicrobiales bacterium]
WLINIFRANLVVQVGIVVREQVAVVHATHEAVRAASLSGDPNAPLQAVERSGVLDMSKVTVERGSRGSPGSSVRVTVRYRAETDVPLVGLLLGAIELSSSAAMRVEGDTG